MKGLIWVAAVLTALLPLSASPIPTKGLSAVCIVEAAHAGDSKVVLVVDGEGTLLLAKKSDDHGNAREVDVPLRHSVIVLHRTRAVFPDEASWAEACGAFQSLVGKKARLETAAPEFFFHDGDLQLVSSDFLRVVP